VRSFPCRGEIRGGKLDTGHPSFIVKLRTSILAIALAGLGVASTFGAVPLKSIGAIHRLTNDEAAKQIPVDFEATVTFYRSYESTLFVQDGDSAIYVQPASEMPLKPGDRIRIQGTTRDSFRPFVSASSIEVLRHDLPLNPVPASYDALVNARYDCQLVSVRGRVVSADIVLSSRRPSTTLEVFTDDGSNVEVQLESDNPDVIPGLIDAEVEVSGAVSGKFDGKMQMTGIILHTQSFDQLKVLKAAGSNPWSLPVTPMDEVFSGYGRTDSLRRLRVQGTVTYYMPGSAVVLQNGKRSIWINTRSVADLRIGDSIDAAGFADVHDGFLKLADSEIRDSHNFAPVTPILTDWQNLTASRNVFDLVSIEALVVAKVREAGQDEYVLRNQNHLFSAIYRHPVAGDPNSAPLPPMKDIPLNSQVRVTGVCILEDSNPFNVNVPFDILMRSFDDIAVIAPAPWLDVPHLTMVVIVLVLVIFVIGIWVVWVERQARRYNAHQAYLERRRGRILEDINNSKPLAEILERITELVSARLNGAPCWCKVADGATLGNCPGDEFVKRLRVVEQEIPGRSSGTLGLMFAAFAPSSKPVKYENEALKQAAGLATLAIETSRLYSDLVHRSEFDLLTDIHNRFSLDKHLESLIEATRQSAGIFGLLYVDLDEFKLVNDQFGHRTGDLYLQEVALRMKRQLRPGDVLARLGGDEFVVVVLRIHSRADIDVISQRLHRSFEQPFVCDGQAITGSASIGIAMYPNDGTTKDSLLSAADSAMYAAKQSKPHRGESRSGQAVR
jgi:diguanylate cyclase (GGDEF)-like protein